MQTILIKIVALLILNFAQIKFATSKYWLKYNDYCDRCDLKCALPMKCKRRRIFSNYICSNCAQKGESCWKTDCCDRNNFYCDGDICQPKIIFKKGNIKCTKRGSKCYARTAQCGRQTYHRADNCCYPMACKGDVCVGGSRKHQQCITTSCNDGLFCDKWGSCANCYKKTDDCNDNIHGCCNGTSVALKCLRTLKNANLTCQPYKDRGERCSLGNYDLCSNNTYCVDLSGNNKATCQTCSLTGQKCTSTKKCCYNTDNCINGSCIKKEVDINKESICSSQNQICKSSNGYIGKCCDDMRCNEIGTCSCIGEGKECKNSKACCRELGCSKTLIPEYFTCQPYINEGERCLLGGYGLCIKGTYCVDSSGDDKSVCRTCSLTGQGCDNGKDCCYDTDKCNTEFCIKREKDNNNETVCSSLKQICKNSDNYNGKCCDNIKCDITGLCSYKG